MLRTAISSMRRRRRLHPRFRFFPKSAAPTSQSATPLCIARHRHGRPHLPRTLHAMIVDAHSRRRSMELPHADPGIAGWRRMRQRVQSVGGRREMRQERHAMDPAVVTSFSFSPSFGLYLPSLSMVKEDNRLRPSQSATCNTGDMASAIKSLSNKYTDSDTWMEFSTCAARRSTTWREVYISVGD